MVLEEAQGRSEAFLESMTPGLSTEPLVLIVACHVLCYDENAGLAQALTSSLIEKGKTGQIR